MEASCQCGALTASVDPAAVPAVVACHCRACQRRTGSPLGVIAYFPADLVTISGGARTFTRPTDSGATFSQGFCDTCGATVWVRADKHPALVGIPVGAFADPAFAPPVRSVWEETRHPWLALPDAIDHYPRGRS